MTNSKTTYRCQGCVITRRSVTGRGDTGCRHSSVIDSVIDSLLSHTSGWRIYERRSLHHQLVFIWKVDNTYSPGHYPSVRPKSQKNGLQKVSPYLKQHVPTNMAELCTRSSMFLLGAICGCARSIRSMDRAAQSMDPYSVQKSMDCAEIDRAGFNLPIYRFFIPTLP